MPKNGEFSAAQKGAIKRAWATHSDLILHPEHFQKMRLGKASIDRLKSASIDAIKTHKGGKNKTQIYLRKPMKETKFRMKGGKLIAENPNSRYTITWHKKPPAKNWEEWVAWARKTIEDNQKRNRTVAFEMLIHGHPTHRVFHSVEEFDADTAKYLENIYLREKSRSSRSAFTFLNQCRIYAGKSLLEYSKDEEDEE